MRNPQVEAVLDANPNIAWEYLPSLSLKNIDKNKSRDNQARVGNPVDGVLVQQYRDAIINGDVFPAIVVYENRPNEYVIVDGNHRHEALVKAGRATHDAYLVLTEDPVERLSLTYEMNELNGLPTSEEDRDRHAVSLVKQGYSMKEAARKLRMPARRVEEVMAEDAGHTRAMNLGVKAPWARLTSRYTRLKLHRELELDSVFKDAVRYAARFQVPGTKIKEFTEEVKANRSERDQLDHIKNKTNEAIKEAERQKRIASGRSTKHRGQPPRILFQAHLAAIKKSIVSSFNEVTIGLTEAEIKALLQDVDSTQSTLESARKTLATLAKSVPVNGRV